MKLKLKAFLLLLILFSLPVYAEQYPRIDISGYKKWEYKDAKVNPQANYYLGLTQLGGYSPNASGSPWQERLTLSIMGQLNEKLAVTYDIEQQPETPDRYNVKVNYDNKHELTFGDINATFAGNEFASTTKYLNGVLLTSKDTNYEFVAVPSAKAKSQIQNLTSQRGNNTKGPYSLGHGSIIEGSERIELNNIKLERGKDYLIDYFEGKVNFMVIITAADEFKYSYEYTTLLDLFFPSLSKKDFFGVQGRVTFDPATWGVKPPAPEPVLLESSEMFPSSSKNAKVPPRIDQTAVIKKQIAQKRAEYKKTAQYKTYLNQELFIANKKHDTQRANQIKPLLDKTKLKISKIREEILDLRGSLSQEALVSVEASLKLAANSDVSPESLTSLEASEIISGEAKQKISQITEDIIAEEASGKYRILNTPVVPFSETITYKGATLNANEDYVIKYDEGLVTLLLPVIPDQSDPVAITYKYYKTERRKDNINGNGGPGPYNTAQKNILPKSEKVYVDGRFMVRDFDYSIDYQSGKIKFNNSVSNTSLINVFYDYQIQQMPPPAPAPKYPKSLTVGMTYLRESSKKSSATSTADNIEIRKGSDIIKADNTIYLVKFPIASSAEGGTFVVNINGQIATQDVDYAIPTTEVDSQTGYVTVIPQTKLAYMTDRQDYSDGYDTGTIKILASVEATTEVSVMYTYKKSIVGRYSGIGNGSRGPFYIKNYRNVVPGTERVEVWTQGSSIIDTYARNSSFEGDAGDKGYSINYSADNAYITFNKELIAEKNFSVTFQYIMPADSTSQTGDITQDLAGVDASFKLGDVLQFEGDYARSSNDQVFSAVASSEIFTNFSNTSKITLGAKPLIDNSEKVYVNNYVRNKDIDYYIDYPSGIITFYYITLASTDVVSVDYQYQSQSGTTVTGAKKTDQAYKYGVKSSLGKLSASYNKKAIGFDFSPLGGTQIGVGSNYQDFYVGLQPTAHNLQLNYSYRETNNPLSNSRTSFSRNYDRIYTMGVNPFNLANISFAYRNNIVKGDPLNIGGSDTADNSLNSYTVGITPLTLQLGPIVFNQKYDAAKTLTEDRIGLTKGNIKSGRVYYSLGITDRVKLSTDMALSEPITLTLQTGEVISSWTLSRDLGYDISIDLTFPKIQKLLVYSKFLNHEGLTIVPTAQNNLRTKNSTYHIDFLPFPLLSTSYDYNRQETPSVVIENKNPMSERTATNVRLSPHPALSAVWTGSEDHTVHETAMESGGQSNSYALDWTPISFEKLKFGARFNYFVRGAYSPSGTFEIGTNTNSFNQDYSVTLIPIQSISIMPGFNQENYFYSASNATTELSTRAQIVKCKISFKPLNFLTFDSDYNLKVTTDVGNNINRHKIWGNFKTVYNFLSWGDIVYNLEEEMNQGEVQAGGSFPDLDYTKTSNTFSLNFNVPQDNPVLSSIVLTATYKLTKFENRIRPTDNLFGYLMSFEGTLNF